MTKARQGAIINMSSVVGLTGSLLDSLYRIWSEKKEKPY